MKITRTYKITADRDSAFINVNPTEQGLNIIIGMVTLSSTGELREFGEALREVAAAIDADRHENQCA